MSKSRGVIRFAVGTPKTYLSAVWRLWVQKNDIYLSTRYESGLYKFSLHQSGKWRLAYTKESGLKAHNSSDRVMGRWSKPPELNGITRGTSIFVPYVKASNLFERDPTDITPDTIWVTQPNLDCKITFALLIIKEFVDINSILGVGVNFLGALTLENRDRVILYSREMRMTAQEIGVVNFTSADMKITYQDHVPIITGSSLYEFSSPLESIPYVVDIPLTWDNVYLKPI